jgi:hypothetical protein
LVLKELDLVRNITYSNRLAKPNIYLQRLWG